MPQTRREWSRYCQIESVASWKNLLSASAKARRGKSRRPDVVEWWGRRESELARLREELMSGTWKPGPYRRFLVHEPKRREIAAAPFADRVVHHAVCNRLAPVLERRFIARSFSCQIGKGTTAARECCRWLVNSHSHVLKCDVRKFFPSIDHKILLDALREWIQCQAALDLVVSILSSYQTGPEIAAVPFPGDDWTEAAGRHRGLPIGNLTSQLWGNFYLDPMDHWITETCRHGAYLRYTDDFLIFGNDVTRLWDLKAGIVDQLASVRLRLAEPKSRMMATREGVPFCGFRFYPDLRPRILGVTKRRFEQRRSHWMRQGKYRRLGQTVAAWYAFSREGNTLGLRKAYSRPRPLSATPARV